MPSRARVRRGDAASIALERRGSVPAARGDAVLHLQRAVGNAAVARMLGKPAPRDIVQRVTLTEHLSETTRTQLTDKFGATIVQDLEEFHDLLVRPGRSHPYLVKLEEGVKRLVAIGVRPTRALSQTLFEGEFWMERPREEGKDYETITVEEGVVSTESLVRHLGAVRPLKDVGAAISHGEWAHRIQLWILNRWAKENDKEARTIYEALRIVTDRKGLVSKEEAPAVWSWVLDIPNDLTRGKERLPAELSAEEVGLAAPARVTMGITGIGGQGDFVVIPGLPTVRHALLNRRLKRYVESRTKQRDLAAELRNLNHDHQWGIPDDKLSKLTTPGREAGTLFTDLATENSALGKWGTERAYATWITRQDLALRQALGTLAKAGDAELGDLKDVVTALGTFYTRPFPLIGEFGYEQRAKVVDALVRAGGVV